MFGVLSERPAGSQWSIVMIFGCAVRREVTEWVSKEVKCAYFSGEENNVLVGLSGLTHHLMGSRNASEDGQPLLSELARIGPKPMANTTLRLAQTTVATVTKEISCSPHDCSVSWCGCRSLPFLIMSPHARVVRAVHKCALASGGG